MIHRECGVLKTSYEADMALYPLPIARWAVGAIAVVFFLVIPLTLHELQFAPGASDNVGGFPLNFPGNANDASGYIQTFSNLTNTVHNNLSGPGIYAQYGGVQVNGNTVFGQENSSFQQVGIKVD